ncbi:DUF2796 domain-containing protein [Zobellella sp. DQSA1]|uniref:DUF2796 domain-containing protein n=1 Tax=Zobellella sp. DQSA1 TaxID=3342386 RepID=UPI0035C1D233
MKLSPIALGLALLPLGLSAQTQLGVHEHGYGMLNLALEQGHLVLELTAPAADLVGFEHEAKTEAELAQQAAAMAKIRQADTLFTLSPAASCRLEKVELVKDEHDDHHDDHKHDHDHHDEHKHDHHDKHAHGNDHKDHDHDHDHDHDEHAHSDVQVHYFYHCEQPQVLNRIDVALFEQFPSFNRIEVQGILPSGQVAATLTPEQTQLSW